MKRNTTLALPHELVAIIDRIAERERRDRSAQVTVLLEAALIDAREMTTRQLSHAAQSSEDQQS